MILSYLPPPPKADLNSPVLSNTSHTVPVYISNPLAKNGLNTHKSKFNSFINLSKLLSSFKPSVNNSTPVSDNSSVNCSRLYSKYLNTSSTISFDEHSSNSLSISSLFNLSSLST